LGEAVPVGCFRSESWQRNGLGPDWIVWMGMESCRMVTEVMFIILSAID